MNTDTPAKDQFEDRLLAAILDDFDELSAARTRRQPSRRRHPHRVVPARRAVGAAVATAAAVALVVTGLTALGSHGPRTTTSSPPASRSVPLGGAGTGVGPTLTTRQSVLYRLASASAATTATSGRYVVLEETDTETGYPGESKRTTVIDTQTGASTTYQHAYPAHGQAPNSSYLSEPATLTEGPDTTSTEAWYSALPTNPIALRAKLLALAKEQADQVARELRQQDAKLGKALRAKKVFRQPALSDDDYVYQEADTLLWSPLVEPDLRSALYKVLAGTSGFTITTHTTDPAGRPAIAMTRHYTSVPETDITYEDPTTGAVLAQVWKGGGVISAVYQPVNSTDKIPPDPYTS